MNDSFWRCAFVCVCVYVTSVVSRIKCQSWFFYPVSTCVRAGVHVCVCVSSHVPDSPLILSLDCCLHAYFLCHYSAVWNCPWISQHRQSLTTTSFYCKCDSHRALFQLVLSENGCFSNSFPNLWTENYVFGSTGGWINFWINNLSNRSHWHNSKPTRSVWRGTARLLLRWPFMSVAA